MRVLLDYESRQPCAAPRPGDQSRCTERLIEYGYALLAVFIVMTIIMPPLVVAALRFL